MEALIPLFLVLPLLGFLLSVCIPKHNEKVISWLSFSTVGLHFALAIVFILIWFFQSHDSINVKEFSIYKSTGYDFYIDFYFDKITATFLFIGAFLTFLITVYSRYYLHREEGYKRFFNVILFFYLGYNLIIFAGNLETMFLGWEILGISSFLLIAFYRDRYLPVKNAVKVFSIYRIGDVGIIMAMWLSHHLWHENISFQKLNDIALVHEHLSQHSVIGISIALFIFLSAAAKSAQFPFSYWLPRAMEGPTPSSAIFYGSLSVHIGAFVLLRTFPFWEEQTSFRWFLFGMGLLTSVMATFIARVQSTVKSQIAYSSIAQIGLIFMEIALGWDDLALVHIAGNAFLRTYQLLVSPSVVSYKIREQFYNFVPRQKTIEDTLPKRLENSLYILSLKEWNLDTFMHVYLWQPMKKIGNRLGVLNYKKALVLFFVLFAIGLTLLLNESLVPPGVRSYLPTIIAILGLMAVLKAFTERKSVRLSWILVIINHLAIALAISFNEHFDVSHHYWFLGGVFLSGFVGLICIYHLKSLEQKVSLEQFYGHVYEHPKLALVFLLAALGLAGFPITPTFIGEDLIFSHIHENQIFLAFFISLSFIIDGLALIRIYARVFLGPHVKNYHGVAKRSS